MLDKSKIVPSFSAWENEYGNNISIYWHVLPEGITKEQFALENADNDELYNAAKKIATTVYHQNSNSITVSNFDDAVISLADCVRLTVSLLKDDTERNKIAELMDSEPFKFAPVWSKQTKKHYS